MVFILLTLLNVVLGWILFYFGRPALLWPNWLLILGFFGLLNLFFLVSEKNAAKKIGTVSGFAGGALLVLACLVSFYPYTVATETLRDIPTVKTSDKLIGAVDVKHIRLVPQESAEWLGHQVIGQGNLNLGSLFEVGKYDIQRVDGVLYWVAPLEYRGFFQWLRADGSPGFVMVNAEDPSEPARLVLNHKMKYMPSGYFGDHIDRYLYFQGYSSQRRTEISFEVDDDLKPYWVVSLTSPNVGFTGDKVTGVVLVNPETGEMKHYNVKETPAWVDRVIPEELTKSYNIWWGEYVHGFWNTWFSNRDIHTITDINNVQDIFLVYGDDEHPKWFAGHTSPSLKDQSLTGYTLMDSISGEMVYYPVGGYGNELVVTHAVEAAPEISVAKNYHAAQPIFYNIYGEESWVVPVLSPNHILEKVAIVYAKDLRHVATANTKEDALVKYRDLLARLRFEKQAPSQESSIQKLEGKIVRINSVVRDGSTVFYIMLDSSTDKIFSAPASLSAELALSSAGEYIKIAFLNTTEGVVPVQAFDNASITLTKSKKQQEFEKEAAVRANTAEHKQAEKELEELEKRKQELQKKLNKN